MFTRFVCDLFGFRARESPEKEKKEGTLFAEQTYYVLHC